MQKYKIYLDNCCFNRPYDNQELIKNRIETETKLIIQESIKNNLYDLCWSYILDYENEKNPYIERKIEIFKWKTLAKYDVDESESIIKKAKELQKVGLKAIDSLHIACSIELGASFFITVDNGILTKASLVSDIVIISPVNFILDYEEDNE